MWRARGSSFGSRHGEFPVSIHAVLRIARADKNYTQMRLTVSSREEFCTGVLKYVHVQFTCVYYKSDQENMVREEAEIGGR